MLFEKTDTFGLYFSPWVWKCKGHYLQMHLCSGWWSGMFLGQWPFPCVCGIFCWLNRSGWYARQILCIPLSMQRIELANAEVFASIHNLTTLYHRWIIGEKKNSKGQWLIIIAPSFNTVPTKCIPLVVRGNVRNIVITEINRAIITNNDPNIKFNALLFWPLFSYVIIAIMSLLCCYRYSDLVLQNTFSFIHYYFLLHLP